MGEYENARMVNEEAVGIYRRLADAQPEKYSGDLAQSLMGLGVTLVFVGRVGEGIESAQGAVSVYRQLAKAEPHRYRGALSNALALLVPMIRAAGLFKGRQR
jgi:hypothetical protein